MTAAVAGRGRRVEVSRLADRLPNMEFDEFTLFRMVEGARAGDLTTEDRMRLQDGHLSHLHELWSQGNLLAAGPAEGDGRVLGLGLIRGNVDIATALMSQDPSVVEGRFGVEYLTWMVPAGMVISGEGKPPASIAEAQS
jgi:uncharacterized protein